MVVVPTSKEYVPRAGRSVLQPPFATMGTLSNGLGIRKHEVGHGRSGDLGPYDCLSDFWWSRLERRQLTLSDECVDFLDV